ncbi:hypothetical protein CRV02_01025 [Arcobacter sp. CECT 8989]|uniref:hypothetical protein n=1 Tax=Arcobacter sp. CECT 8989 TaxID=2044509 RepID=UPI00100C1AB9|nr:hypothetical protein [Arcobacter sp. CECT 8989]RXK03808.1 hypothetical protein CRV02_01025 [Arcobacter sp. CECT 8989]
MKKLILFVFVIFTSTLLAKWNVSTDKDEMTGKYSAYAISSNVKPTRTMNFPYSSVESWIGIGCNNKKNWAYLGFNLAPNLNNTTTRSGYNEIRTRIKFDDDIEYYTLTQDWGSKFIHFFYPEEIVEKIKKSNSMLLELNWHGNGSTYFKYSLNGSTKAINKSFNKCGYMKIYKNKIKARNEELKRTKIEEKEKYKRYSSIKTEKQKCLNNGGSSGWDFEKDIFKCIYK